MTLKRYQNKDSVCFPTYFTCGGLLHLLPINSLAFNSLQKIDHVISATATFHLVIHKPQTIPELMTFIPPLVMQ